ncbi:hypothetical protein MATL_G00156130 [Megalops atlanticus]|uniref:RanBP2-type domain-containing protein n=1 Tax=Megalops atlanticus TaxID=7932 RepID=A0A9D3PPT5_MEGAT|nr:hypothetical protein MATL_G00156130 [Megalops atlanticus]
MAQGSPGIDLQVLHDLRQTFPESPEGAVSQCLLPQKRSDSDGCSKRPPQASGEANLGLSRLRNHMTQLHLGLQSQNAPVTPPRDGPRINGGRTLSHSLSDGPLRTGQSEFLPAEPLSAPAQVPAGLRVFAAMDAAQGPQLGLYPLAGKELLSGPQPAPRFSPITVTLAPNVQSGRKTPTSLHIHGGAQAGPGSPQANAIYIRPYVTQAGAARLSQQHAGRLQSSSLSQQQQQQQQVSQPPSPLASQPQSQGHQTLHVYMPITSPTNPQAPSVHQASSGAQASSSLSSSSSSPSFSQYNIQNISTGPCKNQIEIKLESPQRNNSASAVLRPGAGPASGSSSCPSPAASSPAPLSVTASGLGRSQPKLYISATPPAAAAPEEASGSSGSRPQPTLYISTNAGGDEAGGGSSRPTLYISANPSLQGPPGGARTVSGQVSMGPAYIHHHPPRSRASAASPRVMATQPNTKYTFKITVSPNKPPTAHPRVLPAAFQPADLCSLPSDHFVEPEPHHLSDPLSARRERPSEARRLSTGSDDLAYTQALLLHQRARMERLWRDLELKKLTLERLKEEVSEMQGDLAQRQAHRSCSTSPAPSIDEVQQLRCKNRMLQMDIDRVTKETDLCQAKGALLNQSDHNPPDSTPPPGAVPPNRKGTSADSACKSPQRVRDGEEDEGVAWSCTACTFLNHPALLRCEQCEFPRHF